MGQDEILGSPPSRTGPPAWKHGTRGSHQIFRAVSRPGPHFPVSARLQLHQQTGSLTKTRQATAQLIQETSTYKLQGGEAVRREQGGRAQAESTNALSPLKLVGLRPWKTHPQGAKERTESRKRLLSFFQENKIKMAKRQRGLDFLIVHVPEEKQGGVISGFLVIPDSLQ